MSKINSKIVSSNFSEKEKNTLIELPAKYANVLECKKSDHVIWGAKTTAWTEIEDEFTGIKGSSREIQNLKDKYENMKRKIKKTEADRKTEIFQTGGGTESCTVAPSANHNVLLGIMGTAAVRLQNNFDGDKIGKPLINKNEKTEDIVEEIVQINNLEDEFIYSFNNNNNNFTVVDQVVDPTTIAMENELLGIMGTVAVGLQNNFDGDKIGKPLINKNEKTEDIVEEIVQINNLEDEFIYSFNNNNNNFTVVDQVDDPTIIAMENPQAVVTADIGTEKQQHMWTKWNPQVLKSNKSAELKTPLCTKKNIETTLGESVKKYSLEKLELINAQKKYFENEERRAQEKHSAEELRAQEKHNADELRAQEKHEWERAHYKLLCDKLKYEVMVLKKNC